MVKLHYWSPTLPSRIVNEMGQMAHGSGQTINAERDTGGNWFSPICFTDCLSEQFLLFTTNLLVFHRWEGNIVSFKLEMGNLCFFFFCYYLCTLNSLFSCIAFIKYLFLTFYICRKIKNLLILTEFNF